MADLPAPSPPEGDLDRRVTVLETDVREMKAGIGRLEVSFARMDARMASLTDRVAATEVSIDKLRASMEASDEKLRALIDSSNQSLRAAIDASNEAHRASMERIRAVLDSRMVSAGQMFTIFSGLMAVFFALAGAALGIGRYAGFIH